MEWFAWLRPIANLSLDEWLKILQLAVTTIVSATVAYVTYKFQGRQVSIAADAVTVARAERQLAADKIRMELFEHRIAVYRGFIRLINEVASTDPIGERPSSRLLRCLSESQFLFGEEVYEFLRNELGRRLLIGIEHHENIDFIAEFNEKYFEVYILSLGQLMSPYLKVNTEKFGDTSVTNKI